MGSPPSHTNGASQDVQDMWCSGSGVKGISAGWEAKAAFLSLGALFGLHWAMAIGRCQGRVLRIELLLRCDHGEQMWTPNQQQTCGQITLLEKSMNYIFRGFTTFASSTSTNKQQQRFNIYRGYTNPPIRHMMFPCFPSRNANTSSW